MPKRKGRRKVSPVFFGSKNKSVRLYFQFPSTNIFVVVGHSSQRRFSPQRARQNFARQERSVDTLQARRRRRRRRNVEHRSVDDLGSRAQQPPRQSGASTIWRHQAPIL